MKLANTEKFLWDLYNFIEKVEDSYARTPFPLRTIKEAFYPDLYQLRREYEKRARRKDFTKLISYLKKKGLLKVKKLKEKKALIVTSKGEEKILKIRNKLIMSVPKKKRKDGKWIMVAFDIPEKRKGTRNYFRGKLEELGFQKFQKSIWITPFDVLKEIKEMIQNLRMEKNVKIFLVEETEL